MENILQTLLSIVIASWEVLLESSLFVLFGFFVAGLLKGFIPDNFIQRHLGGNSKAGILKSALFGVPIPLCSCGVIPAAAGLRSQGASKGAVTSFMISTPETGVDSMAVTYALLDPVMTVVRPVAAFLTALLSGIFVNLVDRDGDQEREEPVTQATTTLQTAILPMTESQTVSGECGCKSHEVNNAADSGLHGVFAKFKKGMAFAFGGLLDDIGPWLLVGIVLAGIISVSVSPEFISAYLGNGFLAMAVMIVLATPLYVCATASTPIAAALALKGLSPGAALVFLLAGPATNMATIAVVSKLLGKKTAVIYVSSIMICSMGLGLLVNWLYIHMGLSITGWVSTEGHAEHGVLYIAAAVLLLLLIAKPYLLKMYKRAFHGTTVSSHHHHHNCGCGH